MSSVEHARKSSTHLFSGLPDVVGDGDDEDDADRGPGGHAAAQQVRPHLGIDRSSVAHALQGTAEKPDQSVWAGFRLPSEYVKWSLPSISNQLMHM